MVRENLSEALDDVLAPPPQYSPTFYDFKAVVLPIRGMSEGAYEAVVGASFDDLFQNDYRMYAAVYVASECIAGQAPSFSRFRTFLEETYRKKEGPEGRFERFKAGLPNRTVGNIMLIQAKGETVIAEMLNSHRRLDGGTQSPTECMRQFLYPKSPTEATLPFALAMTLSMYRAAPAIRAALWQGSQNDIISWFNPSIAGDQSFLAWWCDRPERCSLGQ
jgi:hypothetical protein